MKEDDVAAQIAAYLAGVPGLEEPDGELVLKAMEAQHGILVERARAIHSFSHLTLQEYFTAKYIVAHESSGAVERLMAHVGDDRWREVFLLVAGMLGDATKFGEAYLEAAGALVAGDADLVALLDWAARRRGAPRDALQTGGGARLLCFTSPDRPRPRPRPTASTSLATSTSRTSTSTSTRALDLCLARDLDLARDLPPATSTSRLARDLDLDLALHATSTSPSPTSTSPSPATSHRDLDRPRPRLDLDLARARDLDLALPYAARTCRDSLARQRPERGVGGPGQSACAADGRRCGAVASVGEAVQ